MLHIEDIASAKENVRIYRLGGSPLLLEIIKRLEIEEIIDQACPCGKQNVSNGRAAIAMLLNRLLRPKALYKVEDWLAATGLHELLGHEAAAFNDDLLGRMLDSIAERREALWVGLIGRALQAYPDLMDSFTHYDVTSCYFEGEYADSTLAKRGYSRDHRSDTKQINIGLSVVGKSGLPLLYELLVGNTTDCKTPLEHFGKLKALLEKVNYTGKLVVVGDRAMFNRKLISAYLDKGIRFLGPWTPQEIRDIVLQVEQVELLTHPLTFQPELAEHDNLPSYYGVVRTLDFTHGGKTDSLTVLVLYSRGKAKLDHDRREDHLGRVEEGLRKLQSQLNLRRCKGKCYVQERINRLFAASPDARGLVTYQLTGRDGHLRLTFARDEEAIAQAVSVEGRYALVTNTALSADEILFHYKAQCKVEQRFSIFKGPLRVRPIHLHSDRRITALVFLTMIALVIYTILEWLVRCRTPDRQRRWTARAILETFEEFTVAVQVAENGCLLWLLPTLSPDQQLLWQRLELPDLFSFVLHFLPLSLLCGP
jgi:transposase